MLDLQHPFVPYFFFSGLATLVLGLIILRARTVIGSTFLAIVLFLLAWWTILAAFETSSPVLETKVLLAKIEYFPIQNLTPFLAMFVLSYTGRIRAPYPRKLLLLWVIPVFMIALTLTNEYHWLIWSGFSEIDPVTKLMVYEHGPLYWIMEVNYVVIVAALLVVLALELKNSPHARYRWQMALMMLAILGPAIGGIIHVSSFNPIPGLDWGSVGVSFSAVMMVASLFGFRFMDIVPVARDMLLEKMEVGVIVIDETDRVVDLNPAIKRFFGNHSIHLGMHAGEVFDLIKLPPISLEIGQSPVHGEIISEVDSWYCLDFRISEMYRGNRFVGWLGEFRDISFQKKAAIEKEQVNQELSEKLVQIEALQKELREQAIRDPLTGLFNRRFFDETFAMELASARRSSRPLCVLMIDIDHFKQVNDLFGHAIGDLVLHHFGTLLLEMTRKSDIVCRYGGEEFLILMNDVRSEEALQRANSFRQAFTANCLQINNVRHEVTISIGISEFPTHGDAQESLLRRADMALYAAKQAGRNCAIVAAVAHADFSGS